MHQLALLKSENQTLSKRRRTKKNHLRHGGSLTVGEGQDIQSQGQVSEEVKAEMSRARGRVRRVEAKLRRCGTCGKPGHNARTCTMEENLSGKKRIRLIYIYLDGCGEPRGE